MDKNFGLRFMATSTIVASGLFLGTVSAVAMGNIFSSGDSPEPITRNSQGVTIGSALSASTPDEEPDFIKAAGRDASGNIVDGYVKKTDLAQPEPKSPEEAVRMMLERSEKIINIPLYAEDTSTVIGSFQVTRLS